MIENNANSRRNFKTMCLPSAGNASGETFGQADPVLLVNMSATAQASEGIEARLNNIRGTESASSVLRSLTPTLVSG